MSEFKQANFPLLIEAGVPPKLAQQALDILDKQNQGQLPCPLQGEDLHLVQSAWQWLKAKGFFHRSL